MDDVAVVGAIFGTLIPIVMFVGLFVFLAIAARSTNRRKAEEAQARYEFLKKMAEGASFDSEKFIEYEKAEHLFRKKRRIANLKLAAIILLGLGIPLMIVFFAVGSIADEAGWVVRSLGLVPPALGLALLVAAKLEERKAALEGAA